MNLVAVFM